MGTVAVVGTGLIGGSLALALRRAGLRVQGYDADSERLSRALARGVIDEAAPSVAEAYAGADVAFVAVTVSGVAGAVAAALDAGVGAVSDVGSVKAPVVRAVQAQAGGASSRFVGGHPMAGSAGEEGIEGADADLFLGAAWVLTPTADTDPAAFTAVRDLVALTGARIMAVEPELHDDLVAIVSHLPHLAASAVMHLAADDEDHDTLLRLAAGGFRALTRLSGRSAGIWPDICVENQEAILHILDRYMKELERVRELVAAAERGPLLDFFETARAEVSNLPERSAGAGPLVELSMPVPDRPGVLAEVTTLAGRRVVW
jgi:prephenate dehydrogenase